VIAQQLSQCPSMIKYIPDKKVILDKNVKLEDAFGASMPEVLEALAGKEYLSLASNPRFPFVIGSIYVLTFFKQLNAVTAGDFTKSRGETMFNLATKTKDGEGKFRVFFSSAVVKDLEHMGTWFSMTATAMKELYQHYSTEIDDTKLTTSLNVYMMMMLSGFQFQYAQLIAIHLFPHAEFYKLLREPVLKESAQNIMALCQYLAKRGDAGFYCKITEQRSITSKFDRKLVGSWIVLAQMVAERKGSASAKNFKTDKLITAAQKDILSDVLDKYWPEAIDTTATCAESIAVNDKELIHSMSTFFSSNLPLPGPCQ